MIPTLQSCIAVAAGFLTMLIAVNVFGCSFHDPNFYFGVIAASLVAAPYIAYR